MKIEAYLTQFLIEDESIFDDSIVLMIDVLRASTTVAAALSNGAREVVLMESLDRAVKLYNNLSRGVGFLAGERGGIKPQGFDAGNSPLDFSEEQVLGKTVILTTTNGTILFQKAKQAKARFIASFANFNSVVAKVNELISTNEVKNLFVMAAGSNGKLSYEDTLCAGAFVNIFANQDVVLGDSAAAAKDLFLLHQNDWLAFLKQCEHSKKLSMLGFEKDIDIALCYDSFPVVPIIVGNIAKIA